MLLDLKFVNNFKFLVKFGRASHPLCEPLQAHEIIELPDSERPGFSKNLAQLYQNGLSLSDISKQTGKAKNTIRDALKRAGIDLRPRTSLPTNKARREFGKRPVSPYYGFCYFQGRIVPDPREYENLLLIHQLWKSGANPNSIASTLNSKKVPARAAKSWNRNSIVNIIERFKKGLIKIKGGNYELG